LAYHFHYFLANKNVTSHRGGGGKGRGMGVCRGGQEGAFAHLVRPK